MSQPVIDWILVRWTNKRSFSDDQIELLTEYERKLLDEGLEFEVESRGELVFLKIHAPADLLREYCEIFRIRMPLRESISVDDSDDDDCRHGWETMARCARHVEYDYKQLFAKIKKFFNPGDLDEIMEKKMPLKSAYRRNAGYLFDDYDDNFFTPTIRLLIVHHILSSQMLAVNDEYECMSLKRLVSDGLYVAAYPLHDGRVGDFDRDSVRLKLLKRWAHVKLWNQKQPIDQIEAYLGTKIAFYFSWLGFYTRLLLIPSFFGLLVPLYGLCTLGQDEISRDTCKANNVTMCPKCDRICDYYSLSSNCFYSKVTHLFDNNFSIWFALIMAIWATTFLKLWKRYEAVLTYRWRLTEYLVETETSRPEYSNKARKGDYTKKHFGTGRKTYCISFWRVKLPAYIFSYTALLFFIVMVIIGMISVSSYKIWMTAVINSVKNSPSLQSNADLIIYSTGPTFNLITITFLDQIYLRVGRYLTNLEYHRTNTEHEKALTIKLFIFQFINHYSSIIYIAFFKGKFIGYPGGYWRIFGSRQEECHYGGCLLELSNQLAFIMIGKLFTDRYIHKVTTPLEKFCIWCYTQCKEARVDVLQTQVDKLNDGPQQQWIHDFRLADWENVGLFPEYLNSVVQFGFIILFVPAFPIIAVFAVIRNVFEIRLSSSRILTDFRRPIPFRVPGIGIWFGIMQFLSKLAVFSSAVVIAFSSSFIPRLVYAINHGSEENFLMNSLSIINVDDLDPASRPMNSSHNVDFCRYNDYREPPWSVDKYKPTYLFWQILLARFIFIILFQNITYAITSLIDCCIDKQPKEITQLIEKEKLSTKKVIVRMEKMNAQHPKQPPPGTAMRLVEKYVPTKLEYAGYPGSSDGSKATSHSSLMGTTTTAIVHDDEMQRSAHGSEKSMQRSAHGSEKSVNETQRSAHGSDKSINEMQKSAHGSDKSINEMQRSAHGSDKSDNEMQKSAHGSDKSINKMQRSAHGSDKSINEMQRSAHGSDKSDNEMQKSAHGSDKSINEMQRSAHGSDKSDNEMQRSAHGSDKSVDEMQKSAHGSDKSDDEMQRSAHGSDKSDNEMQRSAHGSDKSVDEMQKSAHGSDKSDDEMQRSTHGSEKSDHEAQKSDHESEKSDHQAKKSDEHESKDSKLPKPDDSKSENESSKPTTSL